MLLILLLLLFDGFFAAVCSLYEEVNDRVEELVVAVTFQKPGYLVPTSGLRWAMRRKAFINRLSRGEGGDESKREKGKRQEGVRERRGVKVWPCDLRWLRSLSDSKNQMPIGGRGGSMVPYLARLGIYRGLRNPPQRGAVSNATAADLAAGNIFRCRLIIIGPRIFWKYRGSSRNSLPVNQHNTIRDTYTYTQHNTTQHINLQSPS